jgi:hypothetical protein
VSHYNTYSRRQNILITGICLLPDDRILISLMLVCISINSQMWICHCLLRIRTVWGEAKGTTARSRNQSYLRCLFPAVTTVHVLSTDILLLFPICRSMPINTACSKQARFNNLHVIRNSHLTNICICKTHCLEETRKFMWRVSSFDTPVPHKKLIIF